ncbi:MAG TPA: CcmD family protein [Pirellulales bacterium]|jgi:CcmD family protein|nr:CcmD family protein [Pirellulales bacterium]
MAALATAFACVWIVVTLYVGWLARNQRRLSTRLQDVAALVAEARNDKPAVRKAA